MQQLIGHYHYFIFSLSWKFSNHHHHLHLCANWGRTLAVGQGGNLSSKLIATFLLIITIIRSRMGQWETSLWAAQNAMIQCDCETVKMAYSCHFEELTGPARAADKNWWEIKSNGTCLLFIFFGSFGTLYVEWFCAVFTKPHITTYKFPVNGSWHSEYSLHILSPDIFILPFFMKQTPPNWPLANGQGLGCQLSWNEKRESYSWGEVWKWWIKHGLGVGRSCQMTEIPGPSRLTATGVISVSTLERGFTEVEHGCFYVMWWYTV